MKSMHGCQLAFASPSCLTDQSLGKYEGPACFLQLSFSVWLINSCPASKGIYSRNHAFPVPAYPFQAYRAYERLNLHTHATSYQPRQSETPCIPAMRRLSLYTRKLDQFKRCRKTPTFCVIPASTPFRDFARSILGVPGMTFI